MLLSQGSQSPFTRVLFETQDNSDINSSICERATDRQVLHTSLIFKTAFKVQNSHRADEETSFFRDSKNLPKIT